MFRLGFAESYRKFGGGIGETCEKDFAAQNVGRYFHLYVLPKNDTIG